MYGDTYGSPLRITFLKVKRIKFIGLKRKIHRIKIQTYFELQLSNIPKPNTQYSICAFLLKP